MEKTTNTTSIGITFQMSLDTFLDELHPIKHTHKESYDVALKILEEMKNYRNPKTKMEIASNALSQCPHCIEAYIALGRYHQDVYKRMQIYKEGMELATMNLGKDFFLQPIQDFYLEEIAKPLFHIKYAYACTLYELGYMKKAKQQFQELLHVNPSDHFLVHHFLLALYLYFEELEKCRELLAQFEQDSFYVYAYFLLKMKLGDIEEARKMLPLLKQSNAYLFDILTYKSMNMATHVKYPLPGSAEEANYIFRILNKAIQSQEYLHIFMNEPY